MRICGVFANWDPFSQLNTVNYSEMTHVYYLSLYCTSNTDTTLASNTGNPPFTLLSEVVSKAHAVGSKCLAVVQDTSFAQWSVILANSSLLSQFVSNLVSLVSIYSLDGICLDWESDVTESVYHNLLVALRTALPTGKLISVCVEGASQNWISPTTDGPYIDFVEVMLYDMATPDDATLADYETWAAAWINAGWPTSKLNLGMPFYSDDANGDFGGYEQVIAQFNPDISLNQISTTTANGWGGNGQIVAGGVLWWNGVDLAISKVQWAQQNNIGGMGPLYCVNFDAVGTAKSLLDTIYKTVNGSIFTHGDTYTASFNVTEGPTGKSCTVKVNVGSSTSNAVSFTSGSSVPVSVPITMPAAGTYPVYIYVYMEGVLIQTGTDPSQVTVV